MEKINDENKEELPETYACINKNEKIRMESSSGGIFSLIATYILNQDGIVFGATFNKDLEVCHIGVENVEGLKYLRGSKYVQSNIGETFKQAKQALEENRKVLFTGTPCQIEGLKNFLKKDYENLYTQDIICHGIPLNKVWDKYKKENEKEFNKIKNFYFRNKENKGWNNYQILIEFDSFKKYIDHEDDLYMKIFLNDIALKESCYNCKFKKKLRKSDITLADFWGINDIEPEMNDEKGTSLVFIHSEKGKKLFEDIKNKIIFKEVDFEKAISYNLSMVYPAKRHKNREKFLEDLEKLSLEELCKKYL